MFTVAMVFAGCAAAQVSVAPDAIQVRTGTLTPSGRYEQLEAITAQHGGGCGLYGVRGNLEGAYSVLRNRAVQLGANYVQILRVTEPHLEPFCMNQAFVIDGLAYRVDLTGTTASPRAVTPTATPTAGISGTFSGDIAGMQGDRPFSMRVTFTIVQTGDDVAGAWNTSGGTSGTLKARVEGDRLLGFSAKQLDPCDGDFGGAAVIEVKGARLRGSYIGSGCGGLVNASFVVTRQ